MVLACTTILRGCKPSKGGWKPGGVPGWAYDHSRSQKVFCWEALWYVVGISSFLLFISCRYLPILLIHLLCQLCSLQTFTDTLYGKPFLHLNLSLFPIWMPFSWSDITHHFISLITHHSVWFHNLPWSVHLILLHFLSFFHKLHSWLISAYSSIRHPSSFDSSPLTLRSVILLLSYSLRFTMTHPCWLMVSPCTI